MVRFTALTYIGGLCWLAASTLPQVLILNTLGAQASAYFSISWVITTMLLVLSSNMGSSLVVESAGDLARLGPAVRTVIRHTGGLLVGAAAALCLGAPLVLRLFGPGYPAHASFLLRLLALSAVPNLITATAQAAARVRRRPGLVVAVNGAIAVLVFGASTVLVPVMGLAGMGMAWLLVQIAVAGTLLALRRRWLPPPGPAPVAHPGAVSARELVPHRPTEEENA
jgi:O-antigen/teichoic acid export membrane protein